MKLRTLLLLGTASVLLQTSAALGEKACSDGYVSCVSACVQAKHSQDSCIERCQDKNKACWSGAFGGSTPAQASAAPEQTPEPPAPAERKKSTKRPR
jgi:hypothetical protein